VAPKAAAAPKAASAASALASSGNETAEERVMSLTKQLSRVEEELTLSRQMGMQAVARAEKAEARAARRQRCSLAHASNRRHESTRARSC
jgi:hypothetical protein